MRVSDRLARMLLLLVYRTSLSPKFSGYSFVDEMRAEAIFQLVRCNDNPSPDGTLDPRPNCLKFDLQHAARRKAAGQGSGQINPFAYMTSIVLNVFRRAIKLKHAEMDFQDDCLEQAGAPPSNRRQVYNEEHRSSEPIPIKRRPPPRRPPGRPRKDGK